MASCCCCEWHSAGRCRRWHRPGAYAPRVLDAFEQADQEDVCGKVPDGDGDVAATFGTAQRRLRSDDLVEAAATERVLAWQHATRGVKLVEADGTLKELVEGPSIHRASRPTRPATARQQVNLRASCRTAGQQVNLRASCRTAGQQVNLRASCRTAGQQVNLRASCRTTGKPESEL